MSILLHVFWALVNSIWQSAALAALVFLVLRSARRTTAAQRYVVWGAVLVACALLPAVDFALSEGFNATQTGHPVVALAIPYRTQPVLPAMRAEQITKQNVQINELTVPRRIALSNTRPTAPTPLARLSLLQTLSKRFAQVLQLLAGWLAIHYVAVALALWVIVPNLMLARLALGYFGLRAAKKSLSYRQLTSEEQYAFRRMTLRPVAIGYSSAIGQPCVIGFARPVIALPTTIASILPPPDAVRVLRHECAHISRWDDVANLLQQIIGAILFFNPVVHVVARALEADREIACDDAAATAASERAEFAKCLYEIARGNAYGNGLPATGFARGRRQILVRVAHLLDQNHNGSTRLGGFVKVAAIAVVAAAVPFSYVQIAAKAASPVQSLAVSAPSATAQLKTVKVKVRPMATPTKRNKVSDLKLAERNVQRAAVMVRQAERQAHAQEWRLTVIARAARAIHSHADLQRNYQRLRIEKAVARAVAPPDFAVRIKDETKAVEEAAHAVAASESALHVIMLPPPPKTEVWVNSTLRQLRWITRSSLFPDGEQDDFLQALHDSGFRNLSVDDLISIRNSGVSSGFLRELHAAGLAPMPVKQLIELANAGVSTKFLAGMRNSGYGNLSTKDMVALCNAGVSTEFVSALRGLGYTHLTVSELINLANAGVDADYIASLAKVGYGSLSLKDLIRLRDSGVSAKFIERLTSSGVSASPHVSIEDLIRLRNAGI